MYLCSICQTKLTIPVSVCGKCLKKHGQCTELWYVEAIRLEDKRRKANARFDRNESTTSEFRSQRLDDALYSY